MYEMHDVTSDTVLRDVTSHGTLLPCRIFPDSATFCNFLSCLSVGWKERNICADVCPYL